MKQIGNPFSKPSELKDPFSKSNITEFHIHGYAPGSLLSSQKKWDIKGTIEFQNGDTKGEQIFKAKTMEELLIKMDGFIKSL